MNNSTPSPAGEAAPPPTPGITSLSDLHPDTSNANKGTERGLDMIRASLEKLGAGRSIVLDKNGRIVAGNQTARAAALAGMDDVIVIQTDGRKIVAVQRTDIDLDSPEGRELALVDNRASEVGLEWSADVLQELQAEGLDLSGLFTEDEIDGLLCELDWTDQGSDGLEGEVSGETGAAQSGAVPVLIGQWVGGPQAVKTPHAAGSEEGPSVAPGSAPVPGAPILLNPALLSPAARERADRPLGPQGPPPIPSAGAPSQAAPVEFKEFDESIADGVTMHECPACGHRWAA